MEQTMTGMDFKIREVAQRIRELREISGFTVEEMAQRTNLSVEEYVACEAGRRNLNIAFLYRCTLSFGVDMGDLLEGRSPKLQTYALTRKGEGQRIEEAHPSIRNARQACGRVSRNEVSPLLFRGWSYSAPPIYTLFLFIIYKKLHTVKGNSQFFCQNQEKYFPD